MTSTRHRSKSFKRAAGWLRALILIGLILAIYHPALSFDFVDHDDLNFIVRNPVLQNGFSFEGLRWAFTAGLTEQTLYVDYWQPITVLSRMLDVQLFGMNASGHHFTNILLHILNSFLIWLVFLKLTKQSAIAYMTALLFAIHPLQVEPVVWVTARKDLLSVFFGLLSIVTYLRYTDGKHRLRSYLLCYCLFLLGVLAKPSIGMLPFIFIMMDVWPLDRFGGNLKSKLQCWVEKIPFILTFAAAMTVPFISIPVSMSYYPKAIMLQIASFHYFRYLSKIFLPVNLSVYPSVFTYELTSWHYLTCTVILIALCIYFLLRLRDSAKQDIAFGWLWFVLLLIPFSPVNTPADRFTYLPIAGIIFLVISVVSRFASRNRFDAGLVKLLLLILIAVFGLSSYRQTFVWKDTVTLFEHALSHDSRNQAVQNDYGALLYREGKTEQSLQHFLMMQQLKAQRAQKSSEVRGKLFI